MNINIPDIKIPIIKNGTTNVVSMQNEFRNKKIVLFGIPGAFTPTCSEEHFPGYIKLYNQIINKGVDDIYCLSVNDSFVMNAWGKSQKLENVKLIPDGSGEFTRKMGMLVHKDNLGFGMRSWRYAALVKNKSVVKWFEEPGFEDNHSDDPYGVSSPENILKEI